MTDHLTNYGFTFGPLEVTRIGTVPDSHGGQLRILGLKTPRREIQVYVTERGSVRVFDKNQEWKPVP